MMNNVAMDFTTPATFFTYIFMVLGVRPKYVVGPRASGSCIHALAAFIYVQDWGVSLIE